LRLRDRGIVKKKGKWGPSEKKVNALVLHEGSRLWVAVGKI